MATNQIKQRNGSPKLIAIDGSINDIGIGIFNNGQLWKSYTYRSDRKDSKQQKLRKIATHFYNVSKHIDMAVIELPDHFVRFGRYGIMNFGSLQSLHLAIGSIIGGLALAGKSFVFISPREWKGTKNKAYTQLMIKQMVGKKLNSHESDAIMMGMVFIQKFKFRQRIQYV